MEMLKSALTQIGIFRGVCSIQKTVLPIPKSIKLNHIKGFDVLDFKKHHFKINKTQSGYSFDPFVLCGRGDNFIFFVATHLNHRIGGLKTVLPIPKSIKLSRIKGFNVLSF